MSNQTLFGFSVGDRVHMYDGSEKLRGEVVGIDIEREEVWIRWCAFPIANIYREGELSSIINETKGTTNGQAVEKRFQQALESKRIWPPIFGS